MPIRNLRRSRRGIGAVVTTVMLVAAVSMMGAFLISWSNSSFALKQLDISKQTDSRINYVKESFVVEDTWFYTQGGKYANVTIRNTGDVAIKVTHIYINNTQAWNTGQTITIGSMAVIKVPNNWNTGSSQSIWVETERGTQVKQVWKA